MAVLMLEEMKYFSKYVYQKAVQLHSGLTSVNMMIKENSIMLNKIYNYPTNLMTLVLINYLLISLIAIVKITNVFYGPLRQMN